MGSSIKKADYNLHNYVRDADCSFDEQGFNEVDGLVLTQVSNMDLGSSGIDLYSGKSKTFSEIWKEMNTEGTAAHAAYMRMSNDNKELIQELAESPRFKNMSVSNFVKDPVKNNVNGFPSVGKESSMEQFAAVTITYEQDGKTYNYMSFRATDGSSDGWVENFSMLYTPNTQAQTDSVTYMNLVAGMKDGYITGGGHSKGGGNFEYAYLFCDDDVRKRITKGYVYDSPGVNDEVLSATQYYEDYLRITEGSFICPQDSIFGQLLHEGDNATFIHSTEKGFNQHDPYSWQIDSETNTFVADEQTEFSKCIDEILDRAVEDMTPEQRKAFFEFIGYMIYNCDDEGIDGLVKLFSEGWIDENGNFNWNKLRQVWEALKEDFSHMTPEEQQSFIESLGVLICSAVSTGYERLKQNVDSWIKEKLNNFKTQIEKAWDSACMWVNFKLGEFKIFLTKVYESIVVGMQKIRAWLLNQSVGNRYAADNPNILVDTANLEKYASRLTNVNRRIRSLDRRLDSLYFDVGIKNLWSLVQADALTDYSFRLNQCINYLTHTASDFKTAENAIKNKA